MATADLDPGQLDEAATAPREIPQPAKLAAPHFLARYQFYFATGTIVGEVDLGEGGRTTVNCRNPNVLKAVEQDMLDTILKRLAAEARLLKGAVAPSGVTPDSFPDESKL